MNINIPEDIKIVNLLAPAADAAGRTGAYVSLKNAIKAFIVVHLTQGNAATVGNGYRRRRRGRSRQPPGRHPEIERDQDDDEGTNGHGRRF